MNLRRPRGGVLLAVSLIAALIFVVILFRRRSDIKDVEELPDNRVDVLTAELQRLQEQIQNERRKMEQMGRKLEHVLRASRVQFGTADSENVQTAEMWKEPIAVLVFVCNRAEAIRSHLEKLVRYRPSAELFPIVVSQDCDSEEVANVVKAFEPKVQYVKHKSSDKAGVKVPQEHKRYATYYRIARHYKLGLEHVLDKLNYGSVIITEDDLEIAPDFFDYFRGTRWLLEADKSLYCVSAWNDNGKANLIDTKAHDLLYRSDFFPGLGWMLTRELWQELGPSWPVGFWDDWIRDPKQRKGRSCIRPEVSRTGMTMYGKKGASRGLFFNKHLKQIHVNEKAVNFTLLSLDYLLKEKYDGPFVEKVYALPRTSIDTFLRDTLTAKTGTYLVTYNSMHEYTQIAKQLQIMADTKAGVPRTAYLGIVTAFVNNLRVYVAPADQKTWTGYDVHWEPPADANPGGD